VIFEFEMRIFQNLLEHIAEVDFNKQGTKFC